MKIVGIIPARYGSSRLPGKPLCDLCGKTVIERVYKRAQSALLLDSVVVATDDERIFKEVKSFGGEVVMTSLDHPNGTCRVAQAVESIDCDIVVNVQGDEPFIDPALIDQVASCLVENPQIPMSTLRFPLPEEDLQNPNRVKVVVDREEKALYFSRSPIPYLRVPGCTIYGHLGLYCYRRDFLDIYASLAPTPLSEAESLEQLKAIESGYSIIVPVAKGDHIGFGIDTEEDLIKAREIIERGKK